MKKTSILIITILFTIFSVACNSGISDKNSNSTGKILIESIAIESSYKTVKAGNTFTYSIYINDKISSIDNFKTVILTGFEYCSANGKYISISDKTPNKTTITFYIEKDNIQSNTIEFVVDNRKLELQEQISDKKKTLEKEEANYTTLKSEVNKNYNSYISAEQKYYSYERQCISSGYLTANGDYKSTTPSSVRSQLQYLYEVVQKNYNTYTSNDYLLSQKEKEISSLKEQISKLEKELQTL